MVGESEDEEHSLLSGGFFGRLGEQIVLACFDDFDVEHRGLCVFCDPSTSRRMGNPEASAPPVIWNS